MDYMEKCEQEKRYSWDYNPRQVRDKLLQIANWGRNVLLKIV